MQRLAAVLAHRHIPHNPVPSHYGADGNTEPLPQELQEFLPQLHHLRAQQDRQLQVQQTALITSASLTGQTSRPPSGSTACILRMPAYKASATCKWSGPNLLHYMVLLDHPLTCSCGPAKPP